MEFNESKWMSMINETFQKRTISLETSIFIMSEIIPYLPLFTTIFGFLGFLGNFLTFVQPELRLNNFCVYVFGSSMTDLIHLMINVFPDYLQIKYGYSLPWNQSQSLCKFFYFLTNFLPHLAINFLLLSLIDQFAMTCSTTSRMNRFHHLKMVPWSLTIVTVVSVLFSLYGPILAFQGDVACSYDYPKLYAILNISINGFLQPIVMLIFALLTYRNVYLSRRRVSHFSSPKVDRFRRKFIAMIITQVLFTALFSLQWMVGQTYALFKIDQIRTIEELFTILLILSFTVYFYSLNNVKLFYFSMITSRYHRQVFVKACKRLVSVR